MMSPEQKSYFKREGDEPLLEMTIPRWFEGVVDVHGDSEAVVSIPQSRRLTYRQLAEEVDRLALGLMGLGFERGDRIGIWSTNNIEWLLLQMATARIGAVLVNINPAYRSRELAYALKRSEVQGLFLIPAFRSSDYVGMVLKLLPSLGEAGGDLQCEEYPCLRRVVVFDPGSPAETPRPAPGFLVWRDVIEAGEGVSRDDLDRRTRSLDCNDPINIQYTSGTTGFPKAVELTHRNILNNAWYGARAMHFTTRDRLCVAVPFYHCFGMVVSNLLCLSVGACIVIPCEHFDALKVLQAVAIERCTAIHGVPTMFVAELEHPAFDSFDLTSLRTGIMAGAPCPPELMRRVMRDMHCNEILIGYGQTEASPLTHLTSRDDSMALRVETVGTNLPHQEVKVVAVDGEAPLPLGEVGEVCFRGYHIMRGYYGDAEATREAIDDSGWLHSGDLGSMLEGGYLKITGRLKEMIIRGGENIYPREIEDYLFTHPKVASVAVFGIPDAFYGEELVAWIRLHQGQVATEQEMRDFCRDGLAHFKVPKIIRFVERFPMTVTGKLQKFRMREMMMAEPEQS
ncbi:MAG: AMP-binding protein [Sedimenticola sp.]